MSNPVAIHTGANWKNVNNWHWIEKDCTTWAHERIRSLLLNATFPETNTQGFSVYKINSIEGDVSVNQRKGRVKQLFDLEINFEYKTADGATGTGFISDFTADYEDESDLNIKLSPPLPARDQIQRTIGGVVKAFKDELFEVHGKPLLVEAGQSDDLNTNNDSKKGSSSNLTGITNNINDNNNTNNNNNNNNGISSNSNNITTTTAAAIVEDEVDFPCPSDQLYLMLTDPNRIRSWTRSPANIPQLLLPQAAFTLFDGNIHCKLLSLKSPSAIDMEWKLKHWTRPSSVSITISDKSNGCVLKIKQEGVPRGEAETIKNNWHNYYWNPIKRAFGVIL